MYNLELKEKVANYDEEKRNEIFKFIQNCLSEILDIPQDEIELDSYLASDLGIGSIDLLDLTFQLEENFQIQIPRNGIVESIYNVIPKERFVQGGIVTEEGLEVLREIFGDTCKIEGNLRQSKISELFTVKTFIDLTITQLINKDVSPVR